MTRMLVLDKSAAVRNVFKAVASKNTLCRETDQVSEARALVAEFRPDVAFVADWTASGDGYQLIRELRTDPANSGLYIVLTTVEYSLLTWTHRRKNGVDRMLLKPIVASDVEQVFRSWPASRSSRTTPTAAGAAVGR